MYKKSLVRIETENQTDLSNSALDDIIATNHVVMSKHARERRLSRACKAVIFMIILGLVAIVTVILALAFAHSHNTSKDVMSRSANIDSLVTPNNGRILFMNQENLTTVTNEQTENEYLPQTTVILTSNNLHTLITENIHMSSSVMRTKNDENLSIDAQTMKIYPSLSTIVNHEATISTTIQTAIYNQTTTLVPTNDHRTNMMSTENELTTLTQSQEHIEIFSNNPTMNTIKIFSNNPTLSSIESNTPLNEHNTILMPEDTSSTTHSNHHFDIQSSTITDNSEQSRQELAKNKKNNMQNEDIKNNV